MKKTLHILLAAALCCLTLAAGPSSADSPAPDLTFGGSMPDVPNGGIVLEDGAYVLVGNTVSSDGDIAGRENTSLNYTDAWAICVEEDGTMRWQLLVGEDDGAYEDFLNVAARADGTLAMTYAISGESETVHTIYRLDAASGEVLGKVQAPEAAQTVFLLEDGYLAAGFTDESTEAWGGDMFTNWLERFTEAGDSLWRQAYPEQRGWHITGAPISQAGDLVFPGIWRDQPAYSGAVVRIDGQDGAVKTRTVMEIRQYGAFYAVADDGEGGVLATGSELGADVLAGDATAATAARIDQDGNILWMKQWGDEGVDSWFHNAVRTADGFAINGILSNAMHLALSGEGAQGLIYKGQLVHIDKDGNTLSSEQGGMATSTLCITPDGDLIRLGDAQTPDGDSNFGIAAIAAVKNPEGFSPKEGD